MLAEGARLRLALAAWLAVADAPLLGHAEDGADTPGEPASWRAPYWLADPLLGRLVPVQRGGAPAGGLEYEVLGRIPRELRARPPSASRPDRSTRRSPGSGSHSRTRRSSNTGIIPVRIDCSSAWLGRSRARWCTWQNGGLPGRIVYSESGMETVLKLMYRETGEPLEVSLCEPARFPLATLDSGAMAGAASVQRAFAGGAER